jgi:hypothetical protein
MQKIFLLVTMATVILSCKTKNTPNDNGFVSGTSTENIIPLEDTMKYSEILWIDTLKDLGKIPKKGQVDIIYRFKNIGKKPLSIISVPVGCGCTSTQKPAKPIPPGEESYIKAKFNAESQNIGPVNKSLRAISNTNPNTRELLFKATITE